MESRTCILDPSTHGAILEPIMDGRGAYLTPFQSVKCCWKFDTHLSSKMRARASHGCFGLIQVCRRHLTAVALFCRSLPKSQKWKSWKHILYKCPRGFHPDHNLTVDDLINRGRAKTLNNKIHEYSKECRLRTSLH